MDVKKLQSTSSVFIQKSRNLRLNSKNLTFNPMELKLGTELQEGFVVVQLKFHLSIYRNSIFIKFFVFCLFSDIIAENQIRQIFKWRKFMKNSKT